MWTSLHYAIHGSHPALVAFLREKSAIPNAQTPSGMVSCHLAASRGYIESVESLIKVNCDLKLMTRDKRAVLHSAAETGHLGLIRLFLTSGADALGTSCKMATRWKSNSVHDSLPREPRRYTR